MLIKSKDTFTLRRDDIKSSHMIFQITFTQAKLAIISNMKLEVISNESIGL